MHDQVERVIKCANGDDHADRLVLSKGNSARRGRVQSHRHDVARFTAQRFRGIVQAINGACDLHARVNKRLTPFARSFQCKRFRAFFQKLRSSPQNRDPMPRATTTRRDD